MSNLITAFIERFGYAGVASLMLLENVFPPIPSELIMPFAGALAARGEHSLAGLVLAGAIGSLLGTLVWYLMGRAIGQQRVRQWVKRRGRWLAITPEELGRAEKWFDRRGGWVLLIGRLVPALRSVISLPAGTQRMPLGRVLAWSSVGTLIWTAALAVLGFHGLGGHEELARTVDWVATLTWILIAMVYLWRILRRRSASS